MFSSTQFEAGGGFVSSQPNDSASPYSAKNWGTQSLVPVTVKQLSEAHQTGDEKSSFSIDGTDVTNVTLVGMVSEKAERVTDVTFTLDDGTGRVKCRRWINESFDTKEMGEIHDNMYICVVGHLRSSQGEKQITVFSVRPVMNYDEITFHFIDCVHQHLHKSKLKGDISSLSQVAESITSTPVGNKSYGETTAPANEFSVQISADGLKICDQKVLDFLRQSYGQEKGVHRDEISRQLRIPVEKIMESIEVLEEEGLVYSTIDEYHFKSTTVM